MRKSQHKRQQPTRMNRTANSRHAGAMQRKGKQQACRGNAAQGNSRHAGAMQRRANSRHAGQRLHGMSQPSSYGRRCFNENTKALNHKCVSHVSRLSGLGFVPEKSGAIRGHSSPPWPSNGAVLQAANNKRAHRQCYGNRKTSMSKICVQSGG